VYAPPFSFLTNEALNACKRLQNKKVCCSKAFMDKIGEKFEAIKLKFKARVR
jgi:hypothetical protein